MVTVEQIQSEIKALPYQDYLRLLEWIENLQETQELTETEYLLQSPANAAHLEQSIAEYKAGKVVVRELIDE